MRDLVEQLQQEVRMLREQLEDLRRDSQNRPVQFAPPGGGDPLPEPTALYQVVATVEYSAIDGHPKTWRWAADWVRAHE